MYSAAQALGHGIPIEKLLLSEYVGSERGSSAKQLVEAAQKNGLYAQAFHGLNIEALRASTSPILLLLQPTRTANAPLHWVTYIGEENDLFLIVDLPNPLEQLTYAELLVDWTGTGIYVGDHPISAMPYFSSRMGSIGLLIIPSIFILTWACLSNIRKYTASLVVEISVLLAAPIGWISVESVFDSRSIFPNSDFLDAVGCTAQTYDIVPAALICEWPSDANLSNYTVVDCRTESQFLEGHVPTAINLPIDTDARGLQQFRVKYQGSEKRPLLLYCENERCIWADSVLGRLQCLGFHELKIAHGGWSVWKSQHRP